jgi:hypothetical protein
MVAKETLPTKVNILTMETDITKGTVVAKVIKVTIETM